MRKFLCFILATVAFAAVAHAAVPLEYYAALNGKKKENLKSAIHGAIQAKKVLSYGSGAGATWAGFYITDRMENDEVCDRYSNDHRYFKSPTSAVNGMNIEHSFPKSWWGGATNNAYKDLFNLMPCEQQINSYKSNYAMGVVTNVKNENGCTKVGTGTTKAGTTKNLWEPADRWKGDFARGYMYMATTYSNFTWSGEGLTMLQKGDYPTLQPWAYELLLKWSREDPVDDIEIARNEAVYGIQGNRNPYVDFPNLAEYVWGDSTALAFNVATTVKAGAATGDITPVDPVDPDDDNRELHPEYDDDGTLLNIDALLASCTGKDSGSGANVTVRLDGLVVTYANGRNIFVTDGRRGFLFYGTNSLGLKAGDCLAGTLSGVDYRYCNLPEMSFTSMSDVRIDSRGHRVDYRDVTVDDICGDDAELYTSLPVRLAPMTMRSTAFSSKKANATDASGDTLGLFDNWQIYSSQNFSTTSQYVIEGIPVYYNSDIQLYVIDIMSYSATGLDVVPCDDVSSDTWYDLAGRRVTRGSHSGGIVISHGRKVMR